MTFKGFLINYLSPWYFMLRFMMLMSAGIAWLLITAILAGQGWNPDSAHHVGIVVGLLMAWNALRPWQVGPSYNDIKNRLGSIKDKRHNR